MIDRLHLSNVSRWVWALIVLAILWVVVSLVSGSSVDIQTAYAAFAAATPALFAAALLYVAPRDRQIRIAAFCFAFPLAVNTFIGTVILVITRFLGPDVQYLAPRFVNVANTFSLIGWVFPVVAVFALAAYIGEPETRRAWAIVGAAVVLSVVGAILATSTFPPGLPIETVLAGMLKQSVWIAWGYLLAVALPQRMWLLSIAALSNLLSAVISLGTFAYIQSQGGDASETISQVLLPVLWVLGVIAWVALLAGILRELPRDAVEPEAPRRAGHALSASR